MKKTKVSAVQSRPADASAEPGPVIADQETEQVMNLAMKIARLRRRSV